MKRTTGRNTNTVKKEVRVLYFDGKKVVDEHDNYVADIVVSKESEIDVDLIALKVAMVIGMVLIAAFALIMIYAYVPPINEFVSELLIKAGILHKTIVYSN